MLHAALTRLSSEPDTAVPPGWVIEQPLVNPSTPIRHITGVASSVSDATKALSALAISRRNAVQLFTLCSFVLLVQLSWSLRHELKRAKASVAAGEESSGTYWLKRGELRRNLAVIGFAFFVTACCLVVKAVTARIGHGVWSDMSPSDIVIATLFYQFCIYVCVRLARRGFTLGEMGIVTHAGTALFMETVNMTRTKVSWRETEAAGRRRVHKPSVRGLGANDRSLSSAQSTSRHTACQHHFLSSSSRSSPAHF